MAAGSVAQRTLVVVAGWERGTVHNVSRRLNSLVHSAPPVRTLPPAMMPPSPLFTSACEARLPSSTWWVFTGGGGAVNQPLKGHTNRMPARQFVGRVDAACAGPRSATHAGCSSLGGCFNVSTAGNACSLCSSTAVWQTCADLHKVHLLAAVQEGLGSPADGVDWWGGGRQDEHRQ